MGASLLALAKSIYYALYLLYVTPSCHVTKRDDHKKII